MNLSNPRFIKWHIDGKAVNIPIPEAPGLGIDLNDSLIEETPYQPMNTGTTPLRADGSVAYAV